jgi:hypothetical protein
MIQGDGFREEAVNRMAYCLLSICFDQDGSLWRNPDTVLSLERPALGRSSIPIWAAWIRINGIAFRPAM